MAEVNLKKLSRADLLEMMINFSEEAEAAKRHEQEYKEELEREKLAMQQQMAEERAVLLKSFDEEKAEETEDKEKPADPEEKPAQAAPGEGSFTIKV